MPDENDAAVPVGSALTDDALRSAVDAAPDGFLIVDADGTIVFVNTMAEQLFEYGREELLGESVDRLVPLSILPSHAVYRAAYADHPRSRPMGSGLDLRGRRRSGTDFPVEISLSPLQGRGRKLVVAIVRDVSEREEAQQELERARGDLVVAEERERIARDLHDTVIQRLFAVGLSLQAALARLGAHPVAESLNQAIDNVDETIRDLRSAIFALHSRRAGGARLRDEVITVAQEVARALGFEPQVTFDGPVDSAATDAMQEELVATLREALSNVAKHAHATRVEVGIAVKQRDLVLRVADNGRGIGDEPGIGNGLANMRQRALGLDGRYELSPGESGGTTIVWSVPIGGEKPAPQ
jgi:two-component system sensor histidine kinase DevS